MNYCLISIDPRRPVRIGLSMTVAFAADEGRRALEEEADRV
jgi:hypothetical protein